jgi:hypothetical protein
MTPTDLRAEHEWLTIPIPLSQPAVEMVRLHMDPEVKSSTALVRFPAGWNRAVECRYSVDEEVVMLRGALHISGHVIPAGSYAFIPTGVLRTETITPDQALALAWFSGPTGSTESAVDLPIAVVDLAQVTLDSLSPFDAPGRLLRESPNGQCWLLASVAPGVTAPVGMDVETCDLAGGVWAWTPSGGELPSSVGRCLVRLFPVKN